MPKNTTPDDQDDRQYAEKLLQLPPEVQRQALDLLRANAKNPHASAADREEARRRFRRLQTHLRRLRQQQKNP